MFSSVIAEKQNKKNMYTVYCFYITVQWALPFELVQHSEEK